MSCPCGSNRPLADCCRPILELPSRALTAESLMRARYTAHVLGDVPFVCETVHTTRRAEHAPATIQQWMNTVTWEGLTIVTTKKGQADDREGWVWFEAQYHNGKVRKLHREYSYFRKEGTQWYFVEGTEPPRRPVVATAKTSRNAPCPCGSGKKYKRCCA